MIPFNIPTCVGTESGYISEAILSQKICGDGQFTKKCNAWLEERFHAQKVLLTIPDGYMGCCSEMGSFPL